MYCSIHPLPLNNISSSTALNAAIKPPPPLFKFSFRNPRAQQLFMQQPPPAPKTAFYAEPMQPLNNVHTALPCSTRFHAAFNPRSLSFQSAAPWLTNFSSLRSTALNLANTPSSTTFDSAPTPTQLLYMPHPPHPIFHVAHSSPYSTTFHAAFNPPCLTTCHGAFTPPAQQLFMQLLQGRWGR